MGAIKKFFNNKKILVLSIFFVTVLIIVGTLFLIYSKDQPKVIPEETRGDIRGSLKENVIKPLQTVPGLAKIAREIEKVEYVAPQTELSSISSATSTWQTYKSEEYGFELKYPQEWEAFDQPEMIKVFGPKGINLEVEKLKNRYQDTDVPYWGGKYIALSKIEAKVESINDFIDSLYGTSGVEKITTSSITYVKDRSPDRFGGGTGYYYYFQKNGIWFELSLDYFMNQITESSMIENLESIANGIK